MTLQLFTKIVLALFLFVLVPIITIYTINSRFINKAYYVISLYEGLNRNSLLSTCEVEEKIVSITLVCENTSLRFSSRKELFEYIERLLTDALDFAEQHKVIIGKNIRTESLKNRLREIKSDIHYKKWENGYLT